MGSKETKTRLTIITVSLCCDCKLEATVSSLLKQTTAIESMGWSYELIVVSPDLECSSLKDVTFLFRKKLGIYDAMNYGLEHIKGDFVWFINAGDSSTDIGAVIDTIKQNPEFDIYGFSVYQDSFSGKIQVPRFTSPHPGTIYRASIFDDFKFDVSLPITADRDLFDRCREVKKRIYFSKVPVALFMTDGVSNRKRGFRARFKDGIYELTERKFSFLRIWRFIRYVI